MKQSTKKILLDGQKISVNCIDFDIKVSKPDFKSAEMCEEYGLFEKEPIKLPSRKVWTHLQK